MYVDASAIGRHPEIANPKPKASSRPSSATNPKAFVSPLCIFGEATISLARAKVLARDKNQKPSRAENSAAHKVVRTLFDTERVRAQAVGRAPRH